MTHFSWWNVDQPMNEHACLCVSVQDKNNAPMAGSQLVAEGVSYNGMSRPVRTDTNGQACVTVKRSTTTVTERVKLYVESGGVKFHYEGVLWVVSLTVSTLQNYAMTTVDLKTTIATVIRSKREESGLSQDRLAAKAGISSRYYQTVETAKKQPSVDTLFKIAVALDIDYTELLKPVWDYWLSQPGSEG